MAASILIFPTQAGAAQAASKISTNMGLTGSTFLFAAPTQLADSRWYLPYPTDASWLNGVAGYTVADSVGLVAFNEVAGPVPATPVPKPFTPQQLVSWLGFTPYDAANPSQFTPAPAIADMALDAIKPKLGAINNSGHTSSPVTVVTGGILSTGTTLSVANLVDPVSGGKPGVGAMCFFRPSGAVDFPANLVISCVCTAAGTVAIRVMPLGGLSLSSVTLVGNIFWIW